MLTPEPIDEQGLRKLHRSLIADKESVRSLFRTVRDEGVPLDSGLSPLAEPRRAWVEHIGDRRLDLRADGFGRTDVSQFYFGFELADTRYFFVGLPIPGGGSESFSIELPGIVYEAERRDLSRVVSESDSSPVLRAELRGATNGWVETRVTDHSYDGLGLEVRSDLIENQSPNVSVRLTGANAPPRILSGVVRNRTPLRERRGWTRMGLSVSEVSRRSAVHVERLDVGNGWRVAPVGRPADPGDTLERVRTIEYRNARGERIRAIVNSWGETRGARMVVIPPAWGRTKETLLPLASVLIETFRNAREPIVVLRFDGIRRRGESHNDSDCLEIGRECMRFTASQAVEDILTTLDFVEKDSRFQPSAIGLVTSSVASIEGRRAIASDLNRRISGWVSLVGITDFQSSLRTFSGGIDYGFGLQRGVRFGAQELLGVVCDMDRVGADALEQRLWFLEDARRDMAGIDIPITWIHGHHDAWMQFERVRDVLSCGNAAKRRLIEIPTGHQLRSSDDANAAFGLVASELARMLLGRDVAARLPAAADLALRQSAERKRLPAPGYDLRRFWKDYLVGRRGELGIELLTSTNAYQGLMSAQIRALDLSGSERVADLGSGAGSFALGLARQIGPAGQYPEPAEFRIHAFDLVGAGLSRGRSRLQERHPTLRTLPVAANLDVGFRKLAIPARSGTYDAALASLLIGYLEHPDALLAEIHRILKSNGRLVISTVLRDVDLSKIYIESLAELPSDRLVELFGASVADDIERVRQDFLNDAARIIDLEEFGIFRFWDPPEFAEMVARAGFEDIRMERAFGSPPQAVVLQARRG